MQRNRDSQTGAMAPHWLEWSQRRALREVLRRPPVVHLKAPRLRGPELVELATGTGRA
jgi:hypothetical protein